MAGLINPKMVIPAFYLALDLLFFNKAAASAQ